MTRGAAEAITAVDSSERLERRLVAILSVACGATVANLYYAQPLLSAIGRAFHVSDGTSGLLVTVPQIFYAVGLILIVPLGDLVHRRRLIVCLLSICALGLALAASAPAFSVLAIALAIAATTSVVVQILIPLASTLAASQERGQVVGTVMSGTLTGILLARTVAGVVAGAAGWRTPFIMAAVAMVLLAIALWRALPDVTRVHRCPNATCSRASPPWSGPRHCCDDEWSDAVLMWAAWALWETRGVGRRADVLRVESAALGRGLDAQIRAAGSLPGRSSYGSTRGLSLSVAAISATLKHSSVVRGLWSEVIADLWSEPQIRALDQAPAAAAEWD